MKRSFIILGRMWRVQVINYFSDLTNITLGLFAMIITMVCWLAFRQKEGGLIVDPFVLASAMGISVIRNSQYNLNSTLTDWRFKGLFNSIGSFPVSKKLIFTGILIFNWFVNIIIAMILFGIAMSFESQRQILHYIEWPIFILGFILLVLLSNFMAVAFTFIWKDRDSILIIASASYYTSMYLLGLGIPFNVTGELKWLNFLTYAFPHRYPLAIMQSGWIWKDTPNLMLPIKGVTSLPGGTVSEGSFLYSRGFGMGGQLWIPVVVTIFWIFIFGIISYILIRKRFNFGRRGIKSYKGIDKHLNYISQIKAANSLTELNYVINQINEEKSSNKSINTKIIKNSKKQFRINKTLKKVGDE